MGECQTMKLRSRLGILMEPERDRGKGRCGRMGGRNKFKEQNEILMDELLTNGSRKVVPSRLTTFPASPGFLEHIGISCSYSGLRGLSFLRVSARSRPGSLFFDVSFIAFPLLEPKPRSWTNGLKEREREQKEVYFKRETTREQNVNGVRSRFIWPPPFTYLLIVCQLESKERNERKNGGSDRRQRRYERYDNFEHMRLARRGNKWRNWMGWSDQRTCVWIPPK